MTKISAKNVSFALTKCINPEKAIFFPKFFRTKKGEYGEEDLFIGVTVPDTREVAKKFKTLQLSEVEKLLQSKIHEERLVALFILIHQFEKGDERTKDKIYRFYLLNKAYVNNWDLVDASAYKIVGAHLIDRDKHILYKMAKSRLLWDRRIAIVSTFTFIKAGKLNDTFKIAKLLLDDNEDLIRKAVGWMLREAGKKDVEMLKQFLKIHYKNMPRTMLRYAIEKFPQNLRLKYLQGKI